MNRKIIFILFLTINVANIITTTAASYEQPGYELPTSKLPSEVTWEAINEDSYTPADSEFAVTNGTDPGGDPGGDPLPVNGSVIILIFMAGIYSLFQMKKTKPDKK